MKILMVSGSFYPANAPRAFRTTELAKELVKQGHEVTLYIPKSDYDYSSFLKEYPIDMKYYERKDERRKFVGISIVDRILFRFLNQFCAYPTICSLPNIKKTVVNESGYDLLITIAVPHSTHWAFGKLYQKGIKAAKTWIADCGDPFMLAQSVNYRPPFYMKPLETRWCKLCDYISVPTPGAVNGYYPEFREKIRVIPQAFDFDEVVVEPYVKNPVPTFAYFGRFVRGNTDPRPLLDYLLSTGKDFRFIAYTIQNDLFGEYIDKCGEKLVIRNFLPRLEAIKEMSKMDFLLYLPYKDSTQKPSKLIDYTLSGRPILSIYPYNMDTTTIDMFLDGDYSNQTYIDDIENYNIKHVAQQFLDLCK